jgi:tetratricopeptide (TPR) repeat protein
MISRSYALENSTNESNLWLQSYLKEKNKLPENLIRTEADFTSLSETKFWDDLWKTDWYCDYEKTVAELMLLLEKNDQSTIFDVVEAAVKTYPDSAMIWFFRAKTYLAGNNPKEALKSLSKALSISPLYLDALNLRIQIYKSTGKVPKAVEDAKTVIQIDPYNYSYRKALAGMEIEAGNYQDAIEHLGQYLKYFSNDHESVFLQGQAYSMMKNYDLALERFSEAFKMNRKSSVYVMERGNCYLEKGMYDEAFNDLCTALDLDPKNGEGFYTRGLVCFQKGDRVGACRDWNKAKSLGFLKAEEYILSVCGGVNN